MNNFVTPCVKVCFKALKDSQLPSNVVHINKLFYLNIMNFVVT